MAPAVDPTDRALIARWIEGHPNRLRIIAALLSSCGIAALVLVSITPHAHATLAGGESVACTGGRGP